MRDRHLSTGSTLPPPCDWWRGLIATAILTGCRIGELLTQRWDDIFLDAEQPHMIVRYGQAKGKRDDVIPLHPSIVAHLRKITDVGLHVFAWPLQEKALYRQWGDIQRAAGIELACNEDHEHTASCGVYGFHAMKKSCGTMNAGRMTQAALGSFMRHKSASTTRKHYQNAEAICGGLTDVQWTPDSLR